MSRRTAARKSKSERVRALPWAALLQGALLMAQRWRSLSRRDRARLARLVRDSHGRRGNLSSREQAELRKLLGKLRLRALPGELALLARGGRPRGRRRRRMRA